MIIWPTTQHVNRSVECLGSTLSHCLSKWRRMTQRDGVVQLIVTLATVHLAYSLSTTISIVRPLCCVTWSLWSTVCFLVCQKLPEGANLPSAVGGALSDLVMNGLVSVCYPCLVQSLMPHVKKMAPHIYQVRVRRSVLWVWEGEVMRVGRKQGKEWV